MLKENSSWKIAQNPKIPDNMCTEIDFSIDLGQALFVRTHIPKSAFHRTDCRFCPDESALRGFFVVFAARQYRSNCDSFKNLFKCCSNLYT